MMAHIGAADAVVVVAAASLAANVAVAAIAVVADADVNVTAIARCVVGVIVDGTSAAAVSDDNYHHMFVLSKY